MHKVMGLIWAIPAEYLNSAAMVSLLSVLVLVGLFFYLNWYTGRKYFSIWTLGWMFYAVWLAIGPGIVNTSPLLVMLKHWCVGVSAALLFWGSVQFLKLPSRPLLFCLFIGFLLVWSYVGAYHLSDPLQIRAPIFGVIGLASLVTAFSFYRLRKHREYLGAGLLSFGFGLWGLYLGACPFFSRTEQTIATGFLISAVLQLFIAVSMIILVLEEARAANDMMLNQIRAYQSKARAPEAHAIEEPQYHGVFDRASLSEQLRLAYGDLRQAQEQGLQRERLQALAQMSRGIAHDINNALTPVLGYANLLLRDSGQLPDNVLSYVQAIKNGSEKIAQSVSAIRDFYRVSDGKDLLTPEDLNALTKEVLEANRPQWEEAARRRGAQIRFQTQFDPALPPVMGRKSELRETLGQLALNSIEATPKDGTIGLRTGVLPATGAVPAARVFIEVSDMGTGMDVETRKRCLEPFFSTKGRQGAKGLGLSKAFGVMQRHGGQIEIESETGRGTVMRLVFPPAQNNGTETAVSTHAGAGLPPLKILCIDDEPSILDVLRIIFTHAGHRVELACDGQKGIDCYRQARALNDPFDLVVTDLGMPGLDGQQLARLVKKESPQTPVILLTGWGGIMQAEGNHPEHIDAILGKPPEVNELFTVLRKVAGIRQLRSTVTA